MRVCLNGHEWAKRQCEKAGIAYQSLDNGFLSTDQPERLQQICHSLGQKQIEAFFYRWLDRLPFPLSKEDRAKGYQPRLSVWQLEVSQTHVFSRPLKASTLSI
jgi:hypothetical protein